MKRYVAVSVALLVLLLLSTTFLVAQGQENQAAATSSISNPSSEKASAYMAAGIGAAGIIIGAGFGIGLLSYSALGALGRQPEVAKPAQTMMMIAAALIEGATFFALAICIVLATK